VHLKISSSRLELMVDVNGNNAAGVSLARRQQEGFRVRATTERYRDSPCNGRQRQARVI
jgi:hypothetical protein